MFSAITLVHAPVSAKHLLRLHLLQVQYHTRSRAAAAEWSAQCEGQRWLRLKQVSVEGADVIRTYEVSRLEVVPGHSHNSPYADPCQVTILAPAMLPSKVTVQVLKGGRAHT